jgi:hypothetical protein
MTEESVDAIMNQRKYFMIYSCPKLSYDFAKYEFILRFYKYQHHARLILLANKFDKSSMFGRISKDATRIIAKKIFKLAYVKLDLVRRMYKKFCNAFRESLEEEEEDRNGNMPTATYMMFKLHNLIGNEYATNLEKPSSLMCWRYDDRWDKVCEKLGWKANK